MERRLKERLVGATILVVLIIVIVPELLSGPASPAASSPPAVAVHEPSRNITVDLATSKTAPADDVDASTASAAASSPDTGGEAGAANTPSATQAAPTIATLKAQQLAAQPLENAAPGPKVEDTEGVEPNADGAESHGSSHHWSLQAGSFANRANAEKLLRRLKAHAENVYVSPIGNGAAQRYRVRVGPFSDRVAAEQAMSRLRKEGEAASLVPP